MRLGLQTLRSQDLGCVSEPFCASYFTSKMEMIIMSLPHGTVVEARGVNTWQAVRTVLGMQ